MKNPFITLTTTTGDPIDVNITTICLYEKRSYRDSKDTYTYIVFATGGTVTRNVREKYEDVKSIISNYYTPEKK